MDAAARAGLHDDLVAVMHRFTRGRRRHADAVLVVLDFLGNADAHAGLSRLSMR